MQKTIYQTIKAQADKNPDKIALQAPDRNSLNYSEVIKQIDNLRLELETMGVKAGDRVAVILPNGPEMTLVCLALLSFASIAPLNPEYKYQELAFYLSDLKPSALLVLGDNNSPAVQVAKKNKIKIVRVFTEKSATVKILKLQGVAQKNKTQASIATAEKIALVLHTSGTTSRPKLVPLTQKNIFISVSNTIKTLQLGGGDVCLNVMPLFHIHGFIVTMATLLAGGTIICPSGFQGEKFFNWLEKYKPTWYTASPTIHQAVLKQAETNKEILQKIKLRFIRSSSAPLSPELIASLEKTFQAPVAESYGMTEAALQITSNQLPPGKRKAGSAGRADGPELKIADDKGQAVSRGEIGEIFIKGANVASAYENNPEANKAAFIGAWFRTGDLGYLDKDNFLFITGRSKEMINKGGEKIAPREIEEQVMRYKGVEQAVVFSMPHPSLGEDVGVAIVLKKGFKPAKTDIQKFISRNLADFKVPQLFFFVDELPQGPTGKLQRIGLYEKLKPLLKKTPRKAEDVSEEKILKIWQQTLELEEISIDDNFFEVGGDSLRLNELMLKFGKQGIRISVEDFLNHPTVKGLAQFINNCP